MSKIYFINCFEVKRNANFRKLTEMSSEMFNISRHLTKIILKIEINVSTSFQKKLKTLN